ncbi:MAG: HD domain-containing protein [Candidatus Omnitrophica bacterium]|nr:HD domain-containing protein [Candidatus Omnitrophota bacterium]MDD5652862.1 HD domain-containing protein [Candidatus Omnitrophota bacterium]
MTKIRSYFESFQFKVTLALVASMLFVGGMSNFLIYKVSLDSQFNQLRDKIKIVARTAALLVDGDVLARVPLNHEGAASDAYKIVLERLRRIKKANRQIRFIYTLAKTSQDGVLQFVVDADPLIIGRGKDKLSALPGDRYDATRFPEMLSGFEGPSSDTKLEVDQWGATLSGYAPIVDNDGKTIAILGADIAATDVYKAQNEILRRALFVLIIGIILSVLLGVVFSRRITKPIEKIVAGTRSIASGNLNYQVEVAGNDEISELGRNFNRMARSLYKARRRMQNYVYRVIQSLIRIIEAKDSYTRGHSERVAEYALKIGQRWGLSPEKMELLHETAVLHDIGKLGIQENVLNKKEKLTPEEWELIKKHPVIGEDILRPIMINPEMLAIVRGHHERFDGTGYPDKLSGNNIHLFAQILSIIDSYDAMTSVRAYRPALSKEQAIEELKRSKGTQFNPRIVDVFVKILEEEK